MSLDDVASLSTQPTDYRSDKTKRKSDYSAKVSNPYSSQYGYSSMFSNPYGENRYSSSKASNYPNQPRNSHAQFSLQRKEFVSDADLKKKEEIEKEKGEFLANDPQSQYAQKLENILSEEIFQSIPEIINEHVQRQILQREMEKKKRLQEKQEKEASDRKEKEAIDEFWKWDPEWDTELSHHFPPEKHDGKFGLTEVEGDENHEIVQKHAPEELIRIINKKYNSNSYNPEYRPTEYFIRLSSIQEWFGYEPKLRGGGRTAGITDAQYFAQKGTRFQTAMKGNDDLYDVSIYQEENDAARGPALKALSELVRQWWKDEDNCTDVECDASWFHWDLTKLLARRLGIDLQKKPELAHCFMVKNPDMQRVETLLGGFKKLDKKYGRDKYGKDQEGLISEEARDLLRETKNFW
jgi:hypothetical protein